MNYHATHNFFTNLTLAASRDSAPATTSAAGPASLRQDQRPFRSSDKEAPASTSLATSTSLTSTSTTTPIGTAAAQPPGPIAAIASADPASPGSAVQTGIYAAGGISTGATEWLLAAALAMAAGGFLLLENRRLSGLLSWSRQHETNAPIRHTEATTLA